MAKPDLIRLSGENGVSKTTPFRSAYRQDYGRLIHSPAFRRLQNKTQLYPGQESDFFRNRLTHSIEVANVGVGIVERLNATESALKSNEIDPDLVAFAGLAHDLGHPPFGHNGEEALDDLMKGYGGFEGNAQTLRILTRIEKKVGESKSPLADEFGRLGLDLTFRTLASVLKYDNMIPPVRKTGEPLCKGYYKSEEPVVQAIVKHVSGDARTKRKGKFKSIECSIMDLADDIAYSTYDLEDTLKSGFLTPIDLIEMVRKDATLRRTVQKKVSRACNGRSLNFDIQAHLEQIFFDGDISQVSPLDAVAISNGYCKDGHIRTELTSWLVGYGVSSIVYKHNAGCPPLSQVRLTDHALIRIEILKNLNYELTIRSPRLAVVQYRGYDVVKGIFKALFKNKKGYELLPSDYRELFDQAKSKKSKARVICDFIAGMTDRYAIEFYSRLYDGDESIFKPF